MVLLDGGGEVQSGHATDVTRTWPVDGQFTPRQKAAYEAVLEAQLASIAKVRAGVHWREVHDASSRIIARFLRDERLIRVSPDESIESGAHAIFFPHGVGHLIGLDVHDLRNFGDRPAYPPGVGRSPQFGTRYLRLHLPLQPGWTVTVEPGFYVVPAILADPTLREQLGQVVDFDRAAGWIGFGGIRIEDDVLCTDGEPDVLTGSIPKTVAALESLVGIGPPPEDRL
jgi:Xaa-Pro aminopeptidase